MAKIKILIACGSGIATSTIAADAVKEICRELKIAYEIVKCSMTEIASFEKSVDIIFTTNNYTGKTELPHMSLTGFITGINEDALREKVGKMISDIYERL
ncbi:PTS sugar transporter subunit IIB [Propionispora vibrioides]|uniref:PTS system, galactitol-specific IIB component n=1 Tax=Propionispora vibrioides TaxID=112903 RepID=A0A1H8XWL1_9FIRM|nr:PTS sugar transporter subunit IIB [Propionispora vibrioides]SEP44440.1 PTS system, galactitol-specific IIB component [Propionispora vibrioides]